MLAEHFLCRLETVHIVTRNSGGIGGRSASAAAGYHGI